MQLFLNSHAAIKAKSRVSFSVLCVSVVGITSITRPLNAFCSNCCRHGICCCRRAPPLLLLLSETHTHTENERREKETEVSDNPGVNPRQIRAQAIPNGQPELHREKTHFARARVRRAFVPRCHSLCSALKGKVGQSAPQPFRFLTRRRGGESSPLL